MDGGKRRMEMVMVIRAGGPQEAKAPLSLLPKEWDSLCDEETPYIPTFAEEYESHVIMCSEEGGEPGYTA
jgi:hypothetical protein